MPNHKSAIKRHRQSLKRRDRNRDTRAAVRTAITKVRTAVAAGDLKTAKVVLRDAERAVAKAANKSIYHKRNAARKISRMAALVNKASAK